VAALGTLLKIEGAKHDDRNRSNYQHPKLRKNAMRKMRAELTTRGLPPSSRPFAEIRL
jgi:hypothetical protein